MTFDYDIFCKNLKTLRELAGYSKFQMSIRANIHYQYYCNIENGNRIPSFKIVIAIANALNVSIFQLLNYPASGEYSFVELSILSKLKAVSNNTELLSNLYEVLIAIKTQGEVVE
ncbi:hypothetical protein IMSAG049_00660 [Clostridiales bacterium]|nr:hypothetical protein IMSAG049_00660 [Clostridiales bacterium]